MNGMTFWIVLFGTNLGCACLGFLFGRLTRAAVEVEQHMTDNPEDSPPPTRRRKAPTATTIISVAVVVIGVVTAVTGFGITRNQDRLAGCVVGYSNATADALTASRSAQGVVNEKLDNFMQAILDAFSSDPAVGRQKIFDAVTSYNEARQKAKRAQQANPLPEAPRDACAELLD